jgi:hypothetical protein
MTPSLTARARAALPDGVVRQLDRAIALVPDLRRPPAPIRPPEGDRRLLIAPANFAGQGWAWARAAETLDDVGARNMSYRGATAFDFRSDYEVDTRTFLRSRAWQRAWFEAITSDFTHVLIEAELPLFAWRFRGDVVQEVSALRRAGVRVAMLCHGSDIRLPSRHRTHEPDSPFVEGGYAETERLELQATRNREILDRVGPVVFVSTPDLLLDVPEAVWLPVVVEARWRDLVPAPPLERERPLVVHVPSRAGLKGSELIEETMCALHDEGVVRYERHEGIAADRMPELYGRADIVLDQFSLGIYGVATCEALATGRGVVSPVADHVGRPQRTAPAGELPEGL